MQLFNSKKGISSSADLLKRADILMERIKESTSFASFPRILNTNTFWMKMNSVLRKHNKVYMFEKVTSITNEETPH
jgi:hypothetical protein